MSWWVWVLIAVACSGGAAFGWSLLAFGGARDDAAGRPEPDDGGRP